MKDDFTYITIDEMKILYNMELMFFTGTVINLLLFR